MNNEHDKIEETVLRFLSKGVYQTKIIATESPSVVVWSKTRKCIVGGKGQFDPLEDVAYVWAMDRDEAKYVFHKNYNNKNPQGMLSSISYEILDIMHYNGHIEIEK